ncbi:acetyltransferase, GNAT family [Gottschalkia acidurici 9a]|uniref:Acetyltransferase, GNAT family n=1 Tax=Gottschalkia acidurici (strain ATCC 7906 / DSM 604 / BCRC 14475 / CIP 104303 / KCTC 5404 / NCIMB 10678 / 9a) TaxID=1128398 RepID=K0B0B4_GOTA9|nr:GNAT family N-acetyltransferase [Gottschalkia acidurici]AFS78492.1 acetyltransferase, GNAT family [Gottschalkia acidurici 9a]
MIIREIKKEDNVKIREIIQGSLKSLGLAIPGTAYFDPQLNNLHQYYTNLKHANYWVVEMEGEVVGGIGIAPFNKHDKVCELQKLYLSPKTQGLGFGKKLMETALAFASKHYAKCYLETHYELKTACILYEKFGFKLLHEPLSCSGHSAMNAWYIKDLN